MDSAFAFMLDGDTIVFTVALVLMALIGLVEAIGLGGAGLGLDTDAPDNDLLSWLGVGQLPLLVLLVVVLTLFGVIGLSFQQLMVELTGETITPWLAGPAAAAAALPLTAVLARPLARILPRDETSAIDIDDLVGLRAVIVTGRATSGSPARARVRDHHGQNHYVMAEPDNAGQSFAEGEEIILVRREAHLFKAITEGRTFIPQLDS
ncbi:OB-fold-containig protein [Sphingomonas sp. LaA6.9]|uniref:OB-fold-containig protein n=1 Tax=Sphingomonas sp. LaA6.9 TaxID=2919914 RepID=UPI001F4FDAC0|nr:OB-fold-containig protein [Sphingomonas sp. LaA6.9]MCJ8158095.1 YqiJ family protein [Sphingomonas sp. LaA6.9]